MIFLFSLLSAFAAEYSNLLSLSDMSDLSSRVIQGEVIDKNSYFKNGKIYSTLRIQVEKTYTGIGENEISIEVLGGVVDGIEMQVSGLPSLDIGQQSLLFLDHERLMGFGQGIFHVQDQAAVRPQKTGLPSIEVPLVQLPDEQEAASCLAPMLDSHYAQEWNLKHLYTHHTSQSQSNVFPFGTYEGLSYKILVCSDGKPEQVTLYLEDQNGLPKDQETSSERTASLAFTAEESTVFNLGVHLHNLQKNSTSSGFAIAILYRE